MNLSSVREDTMLGKSGIWITAGPGWRNHIIWRTRKILDSRPGINAYWMGSGRLGNIVPPSGVLSSPSSDIGRLVKQWTEEQNADTTVLRRLIIIEDPQGAGIWDGLSRSVAWKTLLENASSFGCAVMIGTDVGIPRAGMLLEYADWFHLRSGGGGSAVEDLTSGTTSLGTWLDGVGRDIFDDIRVYRRILNVMASHYRDVVIWLSNDSDDFTDRVLWWNPDIENKQDIDPLHSLRQVNPAVSDGATAMVTSRVVRKLRLVIGLLEEVCDELGGSSDDED